MISFILNAYYVHVIVCRYFNFDVVYELELRTSTTQN